MEDSLGDVGDLLQQGSEVNLVAEDFPVARKEDDDLWSDEFLKRPSARVPYTPAERRVNGLQGDIGWDVREVRIADVSLFVPLEHGVDGLR